MDASEKNEMKEKEYNRRERERENQSTNKKWNFIANMQKKTNKQKLIQLIKTASNIELNRPCYLYKKYVIS